MSEYQVETFVCRRCGNCCAIEGSVAIESDEEKRIARWLELPLAEFRRRYLTPMVGGGWSLIDREGATDCIMLTSRRLCRIEAVKPRQCRDFPHRWRTSNAAAYCQGLKEE